MDIDEFLKFTKMDAQTFAYKTKISEQGIRRYRKKTCRPPLENALRIKEISNGLIELEDLGWSKTGVKIPWKKNEVIGDDIDDYDTIPPNAMDSFQKITK